MIQLFRPYVSEEAIASVAEVLRSGWIGLGPKTKEFEVRFAEYVGAKYAVAVNAATSALHLAMEVSGVGPGDEVLTTPLTFVSTNHAILYRQAVPVFVDVDHRTLNLDITKAGAMVTDRTKAIVVVHYGGNPINLNELYAFAKHYNLAVIEDAAHACGAIFEGKKIGSFGLTCFSFHAVKNLPLGDGGMITTSDQAIYDRLNRLRWLGIDQSTYARNSESYKWEYDVSEVGYKYHMNDINAAIGLAHLKDVDKWNARRNRIVNTYKSEMSDLSPQNLRFVEHTPGAQSANHFCAIRVANRNAVADALAERGISIGVHYKPNHYYEMYKNARRTDLSVTERAYSELMTLPLHLLLTDEDVMAVCRAIREVLLAL